MTTSRPASDLAVQRVRHPLRLRLLRVARVTRPVPHIARVTLAGDDLDGFVSASFDDHVKIFLPGQGAERPAMPTLGPDGAVFAAEGPRPIMRDYTPRRFDPVRRELDLEFVLHGAGPAGAWAAQAQPGQYLGVGGPRGSFVVPAGYDWHLLAGDDSALPAIARRLEELPAGTRAIALIETTHPEAKLPLATRADADVRWTAKGAPGGLAQAVRNLALPAGEGYVWAAAESAVARALRQAVVDHGVDKRRIRVSSYWKQGESAVHETHEE